MKGRNELKLNTSTMIEALQLWADATFKNPPKNVDVSQCDNGHTPFFCVETMDEVES